MSNDEHLPRNVGVWFEDMEPRLRGTSCLKGVTASLSGVIRVLGRGQRAVVWYFRGHSGGNCSAWSQGCEPSL